MNEYLAKRMVSIRDFCAALKRHVDVTSPFAGSCPHHGKAQSSLLNADTVFRPYLYTLKNCGPERWAITENEELLDTVTYMSGGRLRFWSSLSSKFVFL